MLVELRAHGDGDFTAYMPADPVNYPASCFHVDDADWRYLMRFHLAERDTTDLTATNRTPFVQDRYTFDRAAQNILAAAAPYSEESDAG